MKRRFRLTRSTDVQRVRRFGKSYAHPLVVLIAFPNQMESVRIGVIAGRSVGKATLRNRTKRHLRAAIEPYLTRIPPGWDIVLIARHPMVQADFQQTQDAITALLRRTNILHEEQKNDN